MSKKTKRRDTLRLAARNGDTAGWNPKWGTPSGTIKFNGVPMQYWIPEDKSVSMWITTATSEKRTGQITPLTLEDTEVPF